MRGRNNLPKFAAKNQFLGRVILFTGQKNPLGTRSMLKNGSIIQIGQLQIEITLQILHTFSSDTSLWLLSYDRLKAAKKTSWQLALALGSKPGDAWQSARWCYDQALKDAARFSSSVNQSKLHWREFLPKGLPGNTRFSYNEVSPGFTSAGCTAGDAGHQCVEEKWTNPFDFGVVSPIAFSGRVKLAE